MPSLKEIKGRIASVNSTRKITSAMKMVASSKLHHAQVAIQNMLPYETLLEHILKSFLAAEAEAQTIYDQERPVKRVALVVFSSNSSLCGGFNANIIKMMTNAYNGLAAEIGAENIEVYPIGRKVSEKATKLGYKVKGDYADMVDHPTVGPCIELARELGERFAKGEVDKVELIYHRFEYVLIDFRHYYYKLITANPIAKLLFKHSTKNLCNMLYKLITSFMSLLIIYSLEAIDIGIANANRR